MRPFILVFTLFLGNTFLLAQNDSITKQEIPEVYIKAVRSSRLHTASSNIIQPQDIQHLNLGQDIPNLIQQLPSMTVSTDAGNGVGYSYLYIRGMDAQRIQVNINGVPYNDAESQEVYWVNIPDMISNADNIEVQRGIGYSAIGGSGIGGTISIKTTKKYNKPTAQISSSFGSFNTFKLSANASTGVLENGWQVTARGSIIQSNGYIDRAYSKLGSIYFNLSKYSDNYSGHLIASFGKEKTYQSWYGLYADDYRNGLWTKNIAGTDYESKDGAPYENQIDNYNQNHLQWINNWLWNTHHQSSLTAYYTGGNGYYEEYKVGTNYSDYSSNLGGSGDLVRQLWLKNHLYGLNASHIVEYSKFMNTSYLSFNQYLGDHYGKVVQLLSPYYGSIPEDYYFNTSNKTELSAFNKWEYRGKSTGFILDLQLRHIHYHANGSTSPFSTIDFNKNYVFFNPKLGGHMQLKDHSKLLAFLGLTHREPVRSDFVDGDNRHNPQPEKVYNLELGYHYQAKSLKATIHLSMLKANIFGMYFNNQLVPTGNVNNVGAPIRENVSKSYRTGIELETNIHLIPKWSFYTTQYLALNKILDYTNYLITYNSDYSVNDSQTIRQFFNSTNIAFSPSWISYAELKYDIFKNTTIRFMNKIVGSQYLDNTSEDFKSIPLYCFTNISISHILKTKNSQEISLNLLLNNIFDNHYISRGYTYFSGNMVAANGSISKGVDYNYYFPQAGFNFLAGVNVRF